MKQVRMGVALLMLTAGILAEGAETVRLSPEGFAMVEGEPRLLIGSYNLPEDDVRAIAEGIEV